MKLLVKSSYEKKDANREVSHMIAFDSEYDFSKVLEKGCYFKKTGDYYYLKFETDQLKGDLKSKMKNFKSEFLTFLNSDA